MAARTILVVEDDATICQLFADVLADEGYGLECASSPQRALAVLRERSPSAFALVIARPFVQSDDQPYRWLDPLRAATSAPILIAARRPEALFGDYRERGFAGFLAEPFDLDDLVARVHALVEGVTALSLPCREGE